MHRHLSPPSRQQAPSGAARLLSRLVGALLAGALACAGAAPDEAGRYPEKKRPEPLRSASDGEVLGANQQSPEDTLEGSLTNEHAAPKGPGAERPGAEEAAPPEPDGCVKAAPEREHAAGGAPGQPRKNRPCPPPAPPPAPGD